MKVVLTQNGTTQAQNTICTLDLTTMESYHNMKLSPYHFNNFISDFHQVT
ncbi:hypothetical protein HanPSC8_Chr16g0695571 [Helianthus annuus]|nr:hypothetical protein HanPSC8_Chr16g0695571 [Helianthus annuus]